MKISHLLHKSWSHICKTMWQFCPIRLIIFLLTQLRVLETIRSSNVMTNRFLSSSSCVFQFDLKLDFILKQYCITFSTIKEKHFEACLIHNLVLNHSTEYPMQKKLFSFTLTSNFSQLLWPNSGSTCQTNWAWV